ncbi:hypothetical protein AAKU55_005922 [Oxalobacteraceae bacterium GrIS 1.11]
MIITCFDEVRVGSVGAEFHHYAAWKTVAPMKEEAVCEQLGKAKLSARPISGDRSSARYPISPCGRIG